ncbi:hypothetical protein [Methanobacterium formicicum]|uniref:Uncharacterized protein n=1 Tax=Methanobacterium formicicum (strain DSM 3637 / PP1) TaxID=1204725 RepID=K2R222_METFP|nr:hypothetical protein [Methanobacterium formicicum]EKF85267.1 hypothetical protein A994_08921 [Methanobacterium formicicum DSM 3637]
MSGKIFMIKENNEFVEMEEKKHARELDFQKLIEEYPDLIPGDQIDSANPRKWLHVGSEVNFPIVGSGNIYLDHLFLDQDGIPTLVEIKRSEDDRLKREVTAQIIEYGANLLLSMDVQLLKERVESHENADITELLGEEGDENEFWQKVDKNLKSEHVRLLVVADEIPQRLQNALEFLNRNMESVEILAVEIKQYTSEGITTVVPRVIGQSIEAQTKKSRVTSSGPKLNNETFFKNLEGPGVPFYEEFFDFIQEKGFKPLFGTKGFSLRIPFEGKEVKILEGYSKIAARRQHLVSYKGDLKGMVNGGDDIAETYVRSMLKIDGFESVGDGFVFRIKENLNEENWNLLKEVLSKLADEIQGNGLKG